MKRIVTIQDFSCVGSCSLTAAIPVLSAAGVECCGIPTALLSNHTGFPTFYSIDLTDELAPISDQLKREHIDFDGVYTGYIASIDQIEHIEEFIRRFRKPGDPLFIDPVMGDNGKMYAALTEDYPARMRKFIEGADIITPNITEVALLLDEPFTPRISPEEIKGRLRRLSAMGPQTVVATSVPLLEGGRDPGRNASVIAYERNEDRFWRIDCAYIPAHYPGTGDTFSSVLTGSLIQGDSLSIALDRAVQFVTLGIRATFGQGLPSREGILLERILGSLFAPVSACKCRLMDGDGCHTPAAPFEG